jgi:hypothetical protein
MKLGTILLLYLQHKFDATLPRDFRKDGDEDCLAHDTARVISFAAGDSSGMAQEG